MSADKALYELEQSSRALAARRAELAERGGLTPDDVANLARASLKWVEDAGDLLDEYHLGLSSPSAWRSVAA